MSDLPTELDPAALVQKVGLAVAAIFGLVWVIRWLAQAHLAALNDRLGVLERLNSEYKAENRGLTETLLKRTDQHNQTVIDIADKMTTAMRENASALKGLVRAFNARPCGEGMATPTGETTQIQAAITTKATTNALHDRV